MIYLVSDIAQEIVQDLNLTDVGAGAVGTWVRNHIGALNNMVFSSYSLNDGDSEISTAISIEHIAVLKKMYELYNYDRIIRANLGASAFSSILEVSDDGGKVRLTSKTELGKIYSDLRKQASAELDKLVNAARVKGTTPVSVDGIDGSLPTDAPSNVNTGYTPRTNREI